MPDLALEVQRGAIPGQPGRKAVVESVKFRSISHRSVARCRSRAAIKARSFMRNSPICNSTVTLARIEPRGNSLTGGAIE